MQVNYHIEGMHCAACVAKVKSTLAPHYKIIDVSLAPPLLIIECEQVPLLDDINKYISLAGKYSLHPINSNPPPMDNPETGLRAYYPIFLIVAYIVSVASVNNVSWQGVNWQSWMNQFMAGFFLVFSAFKFLDIKGFSEGYASYDLLASRWRTYGYIYPFLELSLGILYLTELHLTFTNLATIIIMGFSSLGVINSLRKKQKFQCACLGTILKVPLSNVTLIEDLSMVVLAALSLIK